MSLILILKNCTLLMQFFRLICKKKISKYNYQYWNKLMFYLRIFIKKWTKVCLFDDSHKVKNINIMENKIHNNKNNN